MSDIRYTASNLRKTDELSALESPIHSLHPFPKLMVTVAYIMATTSFPRYHFSGLVSMALYPAVLFAVSGLSVKDCFSKLRFVLPLVCAVGICNPFFDREPLLYAGSMAISGGMVSMVTLMMKGVLCLTASFLLVATTSVDAICGALRMLRVPRMLVTLILLTYRYLFLMADEVTVMTTAYRLRAPGHRGIHFSAWGSFAGQLLLRSMDRAKELYAGMQLRGYDGDFRYAKTGKMKCADVLFGAVCIAFFVICRHIDIAERIGAAIL